MLEVSINLSYYSTKSPKTGYIANGKSSENEHFPGLGEIRGFQQHKKRYFSNHPPSKGKDKPVYRKVNTYTKSTQQYTRERSRRRSVRLLAEKGLTQQQIAAALNVSTRTIKRDWDKIMPYVKGQVHKEIRQVEDDRHKEFERRYEGLAGNEKLKLLKQDLKEATKMAHRLQTSHNRQAPHQEIRRQLDYILDLDSSTVDGFPSAIFPQQGGFSLSAGFDLKFYAVKNGEKRALFTICISKT
jgi:hypothetical protein